MTMAMCPDRQTELQSTLQASTRSVKSHIRVADDWQADELVIVFGGVLGRTGARTNELAWMTTERMEWHLQACA